MLIEAAVAVDQHDLAVIACRGDADRRGKTGADGAEIDRDMIFARLASAQMGEGTQGRQWVAGPQQSNASPAQYQVIELINQYMDVRDGTRLAYNLYLPMAPWPFPCLLIMEGYGIRPPAGEAYFPVEGANGELGFYVVSDGSDRPYRVRCRPPCLPPLAALHRMIVGEMVADMIPTFGSVNMIGGELDR